jgi:hypothetical protein
MPLGMGGRVQPAAEVSLKDEEVFFRSLQIGLSFTADTKKSF